MQSTSLTVALAIVFATIVIAAPAPAGAQGAGAPVVTVSVDPLSSLITVMVGVEENLNKAGLSAEASKGALHCERTNSSDDGMTCQQTRSEIQITAAAICGCSSSAGTGHCNTYGVTDGTVNAHVETGTLDSEHVYCVSFQNGVAGTTCDFESQTSDTIHGGDVGAYPHGNLEGYYSVTVTGPYT